MPLSEDPGVPESSEYCSLCYRDGKFCYEGTNLKEFQNICYEGMIARGMNPLISRFYAFLIRFAPRWRERSH